MIKRVAVLFVLLVASPAQQSSTPFIRMIPGGYYTAGQFSDLSQAEQVGYAEGFINGMMSAAILGANTQELEMLSRCTREMHGKQLAAILDKHLKNHPEGWHEVLTVHSFNALLDVCPDLKKRLEVEYGSKK
jgi:hypothetical protein